VRRPFAVLWLATLLFYLGFQLLLPVIPLYAARVGADEALVGFVMGAFAFAAMVLRPLAGDLVDRIGRWPLVLLGTGIFALASAGYATVATIPGLKGEHGRLGEEGQEAERTLVSLRASHETGVRERERLARELAEVQERHDAAMRERHHAGEELEAILRRFRTSA
jgi:Major Facilitator Superfamily